MKRKIVWTTAVLIGLGIVIFWIVIPRLEDFRYELMQSDLAEKLGVKIADYPPEEYFPESFFYSALKSGMDISEVHKIVIGYEKVFRCGKDGEIYYYFSSDGENALGFSIQYNNLGKFVELLGIDESSQPIPLDGCEPGLLQATN